MFARDNEIMKIGGLYELVEEGFITCPKEYNQYCEKCSLPRYNNSCVLCNLLHAEVIHEHRCVDSIYLGDINDM